MMIAFYQAPAPQINYPRFGKGGSGGDSLNAARLKQIPRRKPAEEILKEMQEEEEHRKQAPPPRQRGEMRGYSVYKEVSFWEIDR
jgi:hypothetical protein